MEWLILLLLVPGIVIPIVLLFGFAGCGFSIATQEALQAPVITAATPLNANTIRLEWTNPNTATVRFDILRTPEGDGPPPTEDQTSPFLHQQLLSGMAYSYRLRAIRVSDGEASEYSAKVATAVTWAEAFSADLIGAGQNVDASGNCIVQRFDPPSLKLPGNLITVHAVSPGLSDADLIVTRVTISDGDSNPAAHRFDSGNQPTVIEGPFSSAAEHLPLLSTSYPVDPAKPLLVAFDVSTPGNTRFAAADSCTAFRKAGIPQQPVTDARTKDRSGFTERPHEVWLITRIDVATEWRTS